MESGASRTTRGSDLSAFCRCRPRSALLSCLAVAVLAGGCRPRPVTELHRNAIDGRFRLGVWNVAESSFVRRPEAFRRILGETDADLFSLDEVGEHITPEQLRAVLHGLRGSSDTAWHLSWGVGGDYQRTVIASRSPLSVCAGGACCSSGWTCGHGATRRTAGRRRAGASRRPRFATPSRARSDGSIRRSPRSTASWWAVT